VARIVLHAAVAVGLLGLGWAVAMAQTPGPDFELVVNAPAGPTSITCVRGCTLMWVERGINPNARRLRSFEFECTGDADHRCSSARVGGWITP
jgi:hypothetical protein